MSQSITLTIEPKEHDLGGFSVRRVLPTAKMRMVGPFIFFDHMGPAVFPAGKGIDVRPHPHIGLATVTYLFEGEIMHRDNLGVEQAIRPGDVNWMTAGKGIVHSERTGTEERNRRSTLHGIQTWLALPKTDEGVDPEFVHHPAATLPEFRQDGATLRLIAGTAFGHTAPAKVYSPLFYLDVDLKTEKTLEVPPEHEERAVYVAIGAALIDGALLTAGQMAVLKAGDTVSIAAREDSRLMLCGGAKMDGPRHMWWNFVASEKEMIEKAKADWTGSADAGWQATPFTLPPGENEFIPLPD